MMLRGAIVSANVITVLHCAPFTLSVLIVCEILKARVEGMAMTQHLWAAMAASGRKCGSPVRAA